MEEEGYAAVVEEGYAAAATVEEGYEAAAAAAAVDEAEAEQFLGTWQATAEAEAEQFLGTWPASTRWRRRRRWLPRRACASRGRRGGWPRCGVAAPP